MRVCINCIKLRAEIYILGMLGVARSDPLAALLIESPIQTAAPMGFEIQDLLHDRQTGRAIYIMKVDRFVCLYRRLSRSPGGKENYIYRDIQPLNPLYICCTSIPIKPIYVLPRRGFIWATLYCPIKVAAEPK